MTFKLQANSSNQAQALVNGHYMPATKYSDDKWYVIIDGKRVEVDNNNLFGINKENKGLTDTPEHFVAFYDEQIKKNQQRLKELKIEDKSLKKRYEEAKELCNNFLAACGVKKYSDISDKSQRTMARNYCLNVSNLKKERISNSNVQYSTSRSIFNDVLDKGDWQNQLVLVKSLIS